MRCEACQGRGGGVTRTIASLWRLVFGRSFSLAHLGELALPDLGIRPGFCSSRVG